MSLGSMLSNSSQQFAKQDYLTKSEAKPELLSKIIKDRVCSTIFLNS
jgi:hypothetical protein